MSPEVPEDVSSVQTLKVECGHERMRLVSSNAEVQPGIQSKDTHPMCIKDYTTNYLHIKTLELGLFGIIACTLT